MLCEWPPVNSCCNHNSLLHGMILALRYQRAPATYFLQPQPADISCCCYFHYYCQYHLLCCKIIFINASTLIDNSRFFSSYKAVSLCELLNSPTTQHQFNKLCTVLENSSKSSLYLKVQTKAAWSIWPTPWPQTLFAWHFSHLLILRDYSYLSLLQWHPSSCKFWHPPKLTTAA